MYASQAGQEPGHHHTQTLLKSHADALDKQDVTLAINRSHEYFDHKGEPAMLYQQLNLQSSHTPM